MTDPANRFMLHIRAAIAEEEARAISARTKAALAAAKARGQVLGFAARPELAAAAGAVGGAKGGRKSAAVRGQKADAFAAEVGPVAVELHRAGHSLRQIGAELERLGIATPRGGRTWQAVQVRALLQRAA